MNLTDNFTSVRLIMGMVSSQKRALIPRILLIDESDRGLCARKIVLEELGHHVIAVRSSREALHQFEQHHFDLIVTEHRMAEVDGVALIERFRQILPKVPVILISGVAEALGLTEASTGADCVIQKNSHEIATLTRSVDRLLARRIPRKPHRTDGSKRRAAAASNSY